MLSYSSAETDCTVTVKEHLFSFRSQTLFIQTFIQLLYDGEAAELRGEAEMLLLAVQI